MKIFEWLFGVKETQFMNFVSHTDLVMDKAFAMSERTYFDLPLDKKSLKKRPKPAYYLDLSNSSNQG